MTVAGCGQVGRSLIEHAQSLHFNATCRSGGEAADTIRRLKARPLALNLNHRLDLKRLAKLGGRVIWLAPPQPQQPGVQALTRLSLLLAHQSKRHTLAKPVITYVSTTGVYGDTQGQWVNEITPTNAQSPRAQRRVQDEKQLREAMHSRRCRIHVLRAPGIYSESRLPFERIQKRIPALLDEQDSWSNHIHELDLARLCLHCNLKGATFQLINACDAKPLKMGDYFDKVADALGLQRVPRMSKAAIVAQVSPMVWSFMQESRRIQSLNISKTGFVLRYPSVDAFLSSKPKVIGHF